MKALGELERLLLSGKITQDEYKKRKVTYIETLLELYVKGYIDEEELKKRLNGYTEE